MPTTNLHFINNTVAVTSNVILIFLQPTGALENYNFYAWEVLNPSIGSTQMAVLTNSFSGSIATYGDSRGNYSRPVALTLGVPLLVTNPNNQSPVIGVPDQNNTQVPADAVGLENQAVTPPTDLSVKWYVNNNLVVETNNTQTTTLNPGFTATFELKQSIYCMLAQPPTVTSTYTIQTFSRMTEFAVPSNATDLYFEAYTNSQGIDTFKQITQAPFQQAQQSALLAAKSLSDATQSLRQEISALKASRASGTASLKSGDRHTWKKGLYTKLAFDWADSTNPGGKDDKVSVIIDDAAADPYSVPQANIAVDKKDGKLTNNTSKTINYTLS
jgi:hypothetical protein